MLGHNTWHVWNLSFVEGGGLHEGVRAMKGLLVALFIYVLVSYQGIQGGPFPSYSECWQYRVDHGLGGSCLTVWSSGKAHVSPLASIL